MTFDSKEEGLGGLPELFAAVRKSAEPTIIEAPGTDDKILVLGDGTIKRLPLRVPNLHHSNKHIGNAVSLAAWLKSVRGANPDTPTHITVGGNGASVEVFTEDPRRPQAALDWYEADYQTATKPMNYEAFLDFIDGVSHVGYDSAPDTNERDDLLRVLNSLEFDSERGITSVKDEGNFTKVTVKAESAEVRAPTFKIPRHLHLDISRGAFDMPVRHRFKLRIDPKNATFTLIDVAPVEHRKLTASKLRTWIEAAVKALGADPVDTVTYIAASPLPYPEKAPYYPDTAAVR
jgi:hypothetical protein